MTDRPASSADPKAANAVERLARLLSRHVGTLQATPLGFAAAIATLHPETRLSDFIAAAERTLGRPLLDLTEEHGGEPPDPLRDEVAVTLSDPCWLTPSQVAYRVRKDETTVIRWCKRAAIGRKVGGRWYIYEPALDKLMTLSR